MIAHRPYVYNTFVTVNISNVAPYVTMHKLFFTLLINIKHLTLYRKCFSFYGNILNLVTKVAQTFPKHDQFLFSMQTGKCHPYDK